MPKLRANGLNFHYWQSGSGPDLVMVHGLGGNLAGWHLSLVPDLQQDYRVTTYDLRGHGRSDVPETGYSTKEMAEDLRRILDVCGIDRCHLVGHSWGVDIALHFALVQPERVKDLVLIEGATGQTVPVDGLPVGQIYDLRWSNDGTRLAMVLNTSQTPGDVYVLDAAAATAPDTGRHPGDHLLRRLGRSDEAHHLRVGEDRDPEIRIGFGKGPQNEAFALEFKVHSVLTIRSRPEAIALTRG